MPYRIKITDDAARDVLRLPGNVRQRARRIINALADDPRPTGAKALRGAPEYYRIRLEDWRIIYQLFENHQVVLVLRVRRKSGPETYRDLE